MQAQLSPEHPAGRVDLLGRQLGAELAGRAVDARWTMQRDQERDVERSDARVAVLGQPDSLLPPFADGMRWKPSGCILSGENVPKPNQPLLMQELAQALTRAERFMTRQLSVALEEEGCTVEQWRILLLLGDGRGHPMSEIAEFALVPAPSLTRLVDRMVTDGLVHRRADPRDRRRVLVHVTPRGRQLHRRLDERLEREQRALLAGAEPVEARRLLGLLAGLVDRLR
jgi:DNA-binding MarR family transcriptional regulator